MHFGMPVEMKCTKYRLPSKYIKGKTRTVFDEHVIYTKFYVD